MAARYLEGSTVVTDITSAATSWTVNAPANIPPDALILIALATNTTTVATAPPGWTLVNGASQDGGADMTTAVLWKKAARYELGAWPLTNIWNSTEIGRAITLVYTGQDQTTPIHKAASATVGTAAVSGPSITTEIDNCAILQVIGSDPAVATYGLEDKARGAIKRFDANDSSFNAWMFVQEYRQAFAGAIALDATQSTNTQKGVFEFAIAPSTVGQTNAFE